MKKGNGVLERNREETYLNRSESPGILGFIAVNVLILLTEVFEVPT